MNAARVKRQCVCEREECERERDETRARVFVPSIGFLEEF